MKCDVCGTKIPLGSNECPNCGYNVRREHVRSFDASGDSHNHIRAEKKSSYHATMLNNVKVNQRRNVHSTQVKKASFSIFKIIFVVFLVMTLVGTIAVPMFMSSMPDFFTEYEDDVLEGMTFQEIVDEGYDDGTISMALQEKEQIEEFMQNKLLLKDISSQEYCNQYDDEIYATFWVEGTYENVQYKINCSLDHGNVSGYDMQISGSHDRSVREQDKLFLDETITNEIGNYIQVDNAYEFIDSNRFKMVKDSESEDRYIYVDSQDYYIYLSESQFGNEYLFYCSIT